MLLLFEDIATDVARRQQVVITNSMRREIGQLLHENRFAFLTQVLPSYGKALERAILLGTRIVEPAPFALLQCLVEKFYDTDDASLLRDIRQLAYLFYKYELPYEKALSDKVLTSFVEVDRALPTKVEDSPIVRAARVFITKVLHGFDHRDIRPRHGPGAVATGERVHQKSVFRRIYDEIEAVYPHCEYYRFSPTHVCDRIQEIQALTSLKSGTAKVVLVPKDSRGPRLISCEPLEYQWIQQGLAAKLQSHIETSKLTKGHVNFTDQLVNRNLSIVGSRDNSWSTLDMKEASDRVSLALVKELFSGTTILEALLATRTSATKLPNGQIVSLNKFAPMGSALCFPVESLVFYALAVATLKIDSKLSWKQAMASVYVYGDDLIVSTGHEGPLFDSFSEVGLLFNHAKCCYTATHFRESCGMDAFRGVDITPIKIRNVWAPPSPTTYASYVSYANVFTSRGYLAASKFIIEQLEAHYGPIAITTQYKEPGSTDLDRERNALLVYVPGVNAVTWNSRRLKRRYNASYQRYEILAHAIRSVVIRTTNNDWEELLRKTLSGDVRSHVGEYSPPRRVELKRVWVEEAF